LHIPEFFQYLETLNIFGVKANYMQQFNEYLSNEGLPPSKTISSPRIIPVLKNKQFKKDKLQKLALPEGVNYMKDAPAYIFNKENEKASIVELDCYTFLEIEKSLDNTERSTVEKNESHILVSFKDMFDYDTIYCELVEYKIQKNFLNTVISREYIRELLARHDWYRLLLPQAFERPVSVSGIYRLEEFAIRLLKRHLEVQYAVARNACSRHLLRTLVRRSKLNVQD
jgi:hypothetical protein